MKIVITLFIVSVISFLSNGKTEEKDTTKATYIPFIDQLKKNDSYTIKLDSWGCFHHKVYKLKVKRKKDKYYVRYHFSRIELDVEGRRYLHDFEVVLSKFETNEPQVMPSDFYTISTKGRTMTACPYWSEDFYYLMDKLTLIESKRYE